MGDAFKPIENTKKQIFYKMPKDPKKEAKKLDRAIEEDQEVKRQRRKAQELAIQAFQFQQVAEKQARGQVAKTRVQDELAEAMRYQQAFEDEAKKKTDARKAQVKGHVAEMLEVRKEEPRFFAKTGIAVIRD